VELVSSNRGPVLPVTAKGTCSKAYDGLPGYLSPAVWQQFFKALHRMVGDAAEHIPEPGKRIDLHQFTGSDKAPKNRRRFTSVVAAKEGPVVSSIEIFR
jgi:hypothetical protein